MELDHELKELQQFKEDREKAGREALQPQIAREEAEIINLKKDIQLIEQSRSHIVDLGNQMDSKTLHLEEELKQLQEQKLVIEREVRRAGQDPDRLRKQNVQFETAKKSLIEQLTEAVNDTNNRSTELDILRMDCNNLIEEREDVARRYKAAVEKCEVRQKARNELNHSFEERSIIFRDRGDVRRELDVALKAAVRELRDSTQKQTQTSRAFEAEKKDFRRRVAMRDQEIAGLGPAKAQLTTSKAEHTRGKTEANHQKQLIAEMQAEVELFIGAYLKLETVDKAKRAEVELLKQCEHDLNGQISSLRQEEMKRIADLKELALEREQYSRQLSLNHRMAREAVEESRLRKLEEADMFRRVTELKTREKEFRALYETVKAERNKYVGMIHRAEQRLAEMRERQRVLLGECEILKVETRGKDEDIQTAKQESQRRREERDKARVEANKQALLASKLNAEVEQFVLTIDRLNCIINNIEKSMLKLKRDYETAVEQRNFSGIRLIDRNDELCVLWERSNAQERLLKENSDRLLARDEEHRRLTIAVEELQRQLFAVQKRLPEVPSLAKEVVELRQKLQQEENKSSELAVKLDDPTELRIRTQAPKETDLNVMQIRARLEELEARLSERKEVLLEKDLILEELTAFSEKLRAQAAEGRDESVAINQQVNKFQARVRDLSKKYMACVAELSMLQAESLSLKSKRETLQQQVDDARENVYNSLPPTTEAEGEFMMMLRRDQEREESMAMAKLRLAEDELEASAVVRTRAEPRVSLYIPEDDPIGAFKAYGAHAPLMPSMLGSTMRHIKKPNPKPIEI